MKIAPFPPLNALRVFLVAARHLSFTRAAVELSVTHGAVSRQVRGLEDHLGVALFERQVRKVVLTAQGQQLFAEIGPAMDQIGAAAQALMVKAPTRAVRINVRPSFTVRWLIPRLPDFVARHPGIEPQLLTSTLPPDRSPESFDIAIRRSLDGWPSAFDVRPFLDDDLVIVAAPSLLKKRPVKEPKSLAQHVLLVCSTRKQDWDEWKMHVGLSRLRPARRLQLDHLHIVLQAAVDGLGVALTPVSLLGKDVEAGRLVCPLPNLRKPLEPIYRGVARDAGRETLLFADWLTRQAQGIT
ncbi:MAG TPA: LysR substrate-binding domain-containing protein [Reyranella sp.]|nr:LysR substrate-binding domain-containing protein [Reyranella sp.]